MALQCCTASRMRATAPSMATLAALESALSSLRVSHQSLPSIAATGRRHASHQAQGRANGAKDGPGKRLGAKKTGGEYVVPGNILFKQRGTHWFPGDNCFMVRLHSHLSSNRASRALYATSTYVMTGPRPHNPRLPTRLRPLLPRPSPPSQAQIYRHCLRQRPIPPTTAQCSPKTKTRHASLPNAHPHHNPRNKRLRA